MISCRVVDARRAQPPSTGLQTFPNRTKQRFKTRLFGTPGAAFNSITTEKAPTLCAPTGITELKQPCPTAVCAQADSSVTHHTKITTSHRACDHRSAPVPKRHPKITSPLHTTAAPYCSFCSTQHVHQNCAASDTRTQPPPVSYAPVNIRTINTLTGHYKYLKRTVLAFLLSKFLNLPRIQRRNRNLRRMERRRSNKQREPQRQLGRHRF